MGVFPKTPVAFFEGGPTDFPASGGDTAFKSLPAGTPGLWMDVNVGHTGTYYQNASGKIGNAATKFLQWKFKSDNSLKSLFCNPSKESELVKAGWDIWAKNGMCT
jgi:hypothetical protein